MIGQVCAICCILRISGPVRRTPIDKYIQIGYENEDKCLCQWNEWSGSRKRKFVFVMIVDDCCCYNFGELVHKIHRQIEISWKR